MRQISNNVSIEMDLHGPNLGVIAAGDNIIVVDTPQKPTEALMWGQELEKKAPIKYIICTEHHVDHSTGIAFVPGQLICREETRKRLLDLNPLSVRQSVQRLDPEGLTLMQTHKPKLPHITFADRLNLYLEEQIIELFPLPGHTSSGTGVYLPKERVLFVGDIVFYKVKSFFREANPETWYQSLDMINKLDVEVIVPGHGDDICDKHYLLEQRKIIQAWVDIVTEAVRRGWSVEEAKETIICPDPYPVEKGNPFTPKAVDDMCISRLYSILKPS